VNKSVNTTAAHVCAFCDAKSLCKNSKCDTDGLFRDTNNYNQQAEDQPEVGYFFKIIFTHSDYSRPGLLKLFCSATLF